MRIKRWSFCPPTHNHKTDKEMAECSYLTETLGPIKKPRKPRRSTYKCASYGCANQRQAESKFCGVHRRDQIKNNRNRRGHW